MTLAQLRRQFVEVSGRYDLVTNTTTWDDKGANWFIQEGQKFLDRLPYDGKHQEAVWEGELLAGAYELLLPSLRVVKSVSVEDSSGSRLLERVSLEWARQTYGNSFGTSPQGSLRHYVAVSTRSVGGSPVGDIGSGLLLLPPSSETVQIKVRGRFFSRPLVQDTDVSFWTLVHPGTLIQGAWYMLERFYRNSEGMKDHLNAIQRDLEGVDFDEAEEDMGGIDQMRNSW